MACGSSFYEENPVKDQLREDRLAEKNLKAVKKIAYFLQKKLDGSCVALTKTGIASHEFKKIYVTVQERNVTIQYRGYNISANCNNPSSLSAEFRNWLATNMTHITKIEPRAH